MRKSYSFGLVFALMPIFLMLGAGCCSTLLPASANQTPQAQLTHVSVLPVFFVPSDQQPPAKEEQQNLMKHLQIAQNSYREMLKGRDTFAIADRASAGGKPVPYVYRSSHNLSYFIDSDDQARSKMAAELLANFSMTRSNLPYILVVILMNPAYDYPYGGGTPVNGGLNTGGGILMMSSYNLDLPNGDFQGTLQHELGHSFGLVHADAYKSVNSTDSIMACEIIPKRLWHGFTPPADPCTLIPEDIRALAQNKLVFPNLYFDPTIDIPPNYQIYPQVITLQPQSFEIHGVYYDVYVDGVLASRHESWSSRQALSDFLAQLQGHPGHNVTGIYKTSNLKITGVGYELYFDGIAMSGPDARTATYDQAVKNLRWNEENHPGTEVVGLYNGQMMDAEA